jgi:hypothetical protein
VRRQVGLKLEVGLLDRVDERCGVEGVTRTLWVERALEWALGALDEGSASTRASEPVLALVPVPAGLRALAGDELELARARRVARRVELLEGA